MEKFSLVSSGDDNVLPMCNIEAVDTSEIVKEEDIAKVYFKVHHKQLGESKIGPINNPQNLQVHDV